MEMYKQAVRMNLQFTTAKGVLSLQQLFHLSLIDIANAIKAVKKVLKKTDDDELSFLEDSKVVDVENQLRFDILKDVYMTKKSENEAARDAADAKAFNQKIDALIAEKQDDKLKNMSIEDLEKLRKK